MQQLIYFFQKYRYLLFFLVLELIAVALTVNNLSFHKSKFVSSANYITGGLLEKSSNISDYFKLKSQNNELVNENIKLKNKLEILLSSKDSLIQNKVDTLHYTQKYLYNSAKVAKNNYHNLYNFITINSGKNKGVSKEMAVVNSKGIIGIIDDVSNNYARVQSILNKNSKINARFKNNPHYGTISWNGKDYNIVQLSDIPRQAIYKKGDTIITDGKSTIFPEGIPIGSVLNDVPLQNSTLNSIEIQLFNDMSSLDYVYVVKNLHKEEIKNLENTTDE